MNKTYPAMDVAKFVMALFVVGVHRALFQNAALNFFAGKVLFSIAVPFFFIASSFLFFRKLRQSGQGRRQALFRFEKRLLILYTLYTILYLPCIFVKNHTGHYAEITLRILAGQCLLLAKKFVTDTTFIHLWYVNTLMLSMLVLTLLTVKVRNKWAVLAVGAASLGCFTALKLLHPAALKAMHMLLTNTIQRGVPCCCIGYFAAQQDDARTRADVPTAVVSALLLAVFGVLSFRNQHDVILLVLRYAATYATAYALLRFCVRSRLQPHPAYVVLRKYSTLIYCLHLLLIQEILDFAAARTGIASLAEYGILSYSVTLFCAVVGATCILLLQKRKRLHWLRYMY